MRAGWLVSLIGHIGIVLMTTLAWQTAAEIAPSGVVAVPVEIVDVGTEANVRALAVDVPELDAAPAQAELSQPERETAPGPAPQRPRRDVPYNLSAAERLLNFDTKTGPERREGQPAPENRTGIGPGTQDITTLEGRIADITSRELNRCWRTVADMPDPERLVVVLAIRLNRDGSLVSQPRVVSPTNYTFDQQMAEAVRRATRAVLTCEPISRLPEDAVVGEHYEIWRDQEVRFGLREQR